MSDGLRAHHAAEHREEHNYGVLEGEVEERPERQSEPDAADGEQRRHEEERVDSSHERHALLNIRARSRLHSEAAPSVRLPLPALWPFVTLVGGLKFVHLKFLSLRLKMHARIRGAPST